MLIGDWLGGVVCDALLGERWRVLGRFGVAVITAGWPGGLLGGGGVVGGCFQPVVA